MRDSAAIVEALVRVTQRNEAYRFDLTTADIDAINTSDRFFGEHADALDRDDALALAYFEGLDKAEAQAEADKTLAAWEDLDREAAERENTIRERQDWPSPDFW